MLYICKGYKLLSTHGNMWLCVLILHECTCVVRPTYSSFVELTFLVMVIKTMKLHVLPNLEFVGFFLLVSILNVDRWCGHICFGINYFDEFGPLGKLLLGCLKCMTQLTMP